MQKRFLEPDHLPTLFASFLYFDPSSWFEYCWGQLGVAVAKTLRLDPAHKALKVSNPPFWLAQRFASCSGPAG